MFAWDWENSQFFLSKLKATQILLICIHFVVTRVLAFTVLNNLFWWLKFLHLKFNRIKFRIVFVVHYFDAYCVGELNYINDLENIVNIISWYLVIIYLQNYILLSFFITFWIKWMQKCLLRKKIFLSRKHTKLLTFQNIFSSKTIFFK